MDRPSTSFPRRGVCGLRLGAVQMRSRRLRSCGQVAGDVVFEAALDLTASCLRRSVCGGRTGRGVVLKAGQHDGVQRPVERVTVLQQGACGKCEFCLAGGSPRTICPHYYETTLRRGRLAGVAFWRSEVSLDHLSEFPRGPGFVDSPRRPVRRAPRPVVPGRSSTNRRATTPQTAVMRLRS